MKLSILICSINKRQKVLLKMLEVLYTQIGPHTIKPIREKNCKFYQITSNDVEVLVCIDNKEMRVGTKRNLLISKSSGEYIVFVDDDDIISNDYVASLLKGIKTKKDVILFDVEISINGSKFKKVKYDANYFKDRDLRDHYERIPNHIMCWRRKIVKVNFPNISLGEDAVWSKKMKKYIKSQAKIDKTLYFYIFNQKTTETQ